MDEAITITALQERMTKILSALDELCAKYDVKYYLFAGSLIGAIRHQGFIPWDDDVDVVMTRKNWEKFRDKFLEDKPKGFDIVSQDINPNSGMPINRFIDSTTTNIYRYHLTNPEIAGIPIDIIVLDAIPNDNEAWKKYVDEVLELQDFTNPVYFYAPRKLGNPGTSTHVRENLELVKEKGLRKVIDEKMESLTQYDEDECDFLVQRFGGAPNVYPIELFGEPRRVKYGDIYVSVPRYAEEVLFLAYGDWMNIPRSGSTLSSHEFSVRSFSIPSDAYFNCFNRQINRKELLDNYWTRKFIHEDNVNRTFTSQISTDIIHALKVKMNYEKNSDGVNIKDLLESKKYDELYDLLSEFIKTQCSEMLSGSPSVMGWKRWYRRNDPLFIDINDEAIAASILVLLQKGEVSKAYTVLKARIHSQKELSPEILEVEEIFSATREAIKIYYNEEFDKCKKIVSDYLPRFEDNCQLWILGYKLGINDDLDIGLSKFPSNPELLEAKAEKLLDGKKYDEVYELLEYLIFSTDNGLVLRALKEKLFQVYESNNIDELRKYYIAAKQRLCEKLTKEETLFTETYFIERKKTESVPTTLTGAFAIRMNLLREIDQICKENNIEYILWGKLLLQLSLNGDAINPNTDFTIAMTCEGALKFVNYLENNLLNNRHLECMKTNPKCSKFEMYYCDTNTLDFSFDKMGERSIFGINVRIVILRSKLDSRFLNLYNRAIEIGWKQQTTKEVATFRQKLTYAYVRMMKFFYGKKTSAKIFNKLIKAGAISKKGAYYSNPFSPTEGSVPRKYFNEKMEVEFFGNKYFVPKEYKSFLIILYNGNVEKINSSITELHTKRIVDSNIAYEDFIKYLIDNNIDYEAIYQQNKQIKIVNNKLYVYNQRIGEYWEMMVDVAKQLQESEEFIAEINLEK